MRGRCSGSDAPGGGRESCQADGEDGRSGGRRRRRRCDAEPVLRRAVQSEPGRESTSCNLGTGGGGGTCASSRAPRCPLRPAKPGAAARRSLWMSRRPPTGWPPSRTGSCESPATMATTRVTPARKVRRRGAALLEARRGVGGGRERRPVTCSLAVPPLPPSWPRGHRVKRMCAVLGAEPWKRNGAPSFAPRSSETVAAFGAEAQRGPGELSRRPSALHPGLIYDPRR